MFNFFYISLDDRLTGSRVYLESLQQIFVQDGRSGLVEVQYAPGCRILFLYIGGSLPRIYQIDEAGKSLISIQALGRYWDGAEAPIFQIELSNQAVRTVWQLLEWHPPAQVRKAHCADLSGMLQDFHAQAAEGMLRLTAPALDGFIPLLAGSPLSLETIFAAPRGLEEGMPALQRELGTRREQECSLYYYPASPGSASDLIVLRQALIGWTSRLLGRYQKMVGMNLVNALDYQVNTALRLKHFNLRLVGMQLVENHFFLELEEAVPAYRYFLDQVSAQMKQVLGGGLVERLLAETLDKLEERSRRALARSGLDAPRAREVE